MLAKELISNDISPLSSKETGINALNMMDEYKVSHMPIVDSSVLVGLIFEDDIFDMLNPERPIIESLQLITKKYVYQNQHVYDVVKEFADNRLTLLPVVDMEMNYLGLIKMNTLIKSLSNFASIHQSGGIIMLSMRTHDYSLGHIAQLVEQNGAIILSSYLYSIPETSTLEVHIKLNTMEINPIIQTLERYNYQIINTIVDNKEEEMDDRFDNLMKYLSI